MVNDKEFWRLAAACRYVDPDLFFPISTKGKAVEQAGVAKAFCAHCEVVQSCLDFALRTHQAHGIWGGTTEQERIGLRREALRADPVALGSRRRAVHEDQSPAPGSLVG
ncbi:MAG TPA: WhiB family transcriptional regulator [Trebonia sp.]|jgi:WhiB family redox-sensing transcriptional regulator